jgi:hypothetical protein
MKRGGCTGTTSPLPYKGLPEAVVVPRDGLRNATSRLDPVSQKEVVSFLQENAAETGLAIVLVTSRPGYCQDDIHTDHRSRRP